MVVRAEVLLPSFGTLKNTSSSISSWKEEIGSGSCDSTTIVFEVAAVRDGAIITYRAVVVRRVRAGVVDMFRPALCLLESLLLVDCRRRCLR